MSSKIKSFTSKTEYIWKYTAVFIFLGLCIFGQFIIYHKTLVWKEDGFTQWYSLLVDFKRTVEYFIDGNGLELWKWNTGIGADLIGNYSFFIFDPFSYITLFFSNEKMDVAYSVIVILKLYAAGLAMLSYLKYRKLDKLWVISGALCYALSAWSIVSVNHEFFLTQLILFPLIIYGADKIINRESPACFVVSVALTIANSLYFTYMSALCAVVYVIVKYLCEKKEKTIKDFSLYILQFAKYVIVSALMVAVAFLPVFYTLVNASKSSGTDDGFLLGFFETIKALIGVTGDMQVNSSYSNIGLNAVILIAFPMIFMNIRKKNTMSILSLICFIVMAIPGLQLVLNGFSYATMRWGYVFSFFFIVAGVECLNHRKTDILSDRYKKITAIVYGTMVMAAIILLCERYMSFKDFMFICLNMLMMVALFGIYKSLDFEKGKYRFMFFMSICFSVVIIPFLQYNPNVGNRINNFLSQGEAYGAYQTLNLRVAEKIDDDDFYRIDTVDSTTQEGKYAPFLHVATNANIYWNVNGISEYLSTLDGRWQEYNKVLGNSCGYYRRVSIWNNDNRARMDYLLGIKYFLGDDRQKSNRNISGYAAKSFDKTDEIDDVTVLNSKYNPGLGYVFENVISESDLSKYSFTEREQILMQAATVEDKHKEKFKNTNVEAFDIEQKNISYDMKYNDGIIADENVFDVKKANTNITFTLNETIKKSEVYLVIKNLRKKAYTVDELWEQNENSKAADKLTKNKFYSNYVSYAPTGRFSIMVNNGIITKRIANLEGEPQAVVDVTDYCVNMGYVDKFDGNIVCKFSDIGHYTYDDIQIVAVPQDTFDTQAAKLEQNRFTVDTKENNYIAGNIDTENGGLLYLSVLYNDGWKIFVDGKQVEDVYLTDIAFTGIEVPAGKHRVELKYRPVGYPYTLICSVIGIIIFITIIVLYEKRKRR